MTNKRPSDFSLTGRRYSQPWLEASLAGLAATRREGLRCVGLTPSRMSKGIAGSGCCAACGRGRLDVIVGEQARQKPFNRSR
jgi:hypothetical protein